MQTFYLRDRDGNLVPVPNVSYEDFLRLYELDQGLKNPVQPPSYSIDRIELAAETEDHQATIQAKFSIRQLVAGQTRVPLRLTHAILLEPAEYEGDGEHVIQSANPRGGYVSWLKGSANQTHTIRLKLLVPVSQVGRRSRLNVALPRAASTQLRLTVSEQEATATVSEPGRILKTVTMDGGSRFTIQGLVGDAQVAWGELEPGIRVQPQFVEANGTIQVRVKRPGAVSTNARFRLTSFGRKMDVIRIHLPPGSKPAASASPHYSIEFVEPVSDTDSSESPLAIVKFTKPTNGPIDVDISSEQTRISERASAAMDILGYEVEGATRHFGILSVSATPDWQVRWDDNSLLHRLGNVPDSVPQDNLVAAFEYYQQPNTLPVRIQAKETRISVEPLLVYDIRDSEILMHGTFDFRVRGSSASYLRMDLEGWEVTDIDNPNVVGEIALPTSDVTPLEIPLQTARSGDFQITLTARRKRIADEQLRLRLPSVRGATMSPPIVIVVPEDRLDLNADAEAMTLFDSEPLPDNLDLPQRERNPLCYRYLGELGHAELVYDVELKDQSISIVSESQVRVSNQQAHVEQRLDYVIRYRPTERLRWKVPRALTADETLRVTLNDEIYDLTRVRRSLPEEAGNPADGNENLPPLNSAFEWWDIPLPTPRDGPISATIKYVVPLDRYQETITASLPVVQPEETLDAANLIVDSPGQIAVSVDEGGNWIGEEFPASDGNQSRRYQSSSLPDAIQLTVRILSASQEEATIIDRTYVQSWMTANQRQDRVVFVLTDAAGILPITLPQDANADLAQFRLNGDPLPLERDATGRFSIPWGDSPEGVVEISYPYLERPHPGPMQLELPVMERGKWSREVYWQLVLPANEHLVTYPQNLVPADAWSWQGFAFQRTPERDQAWLEAWSRASRQQPPYSSNVYLMRGFGDLDNVSVVTMKRQYLVLIASGTTLLLGLVWRLLDWTVHPWWISTVSIVLLAIFWLYPAPAAIVLQAAVLGCGLVVASWVLDRVISQTGLRHSDDTTVRAQPKSGVRVSVSTGSSQAGPLTSTETKPLPLSVPD